MTRRSRSLTSGSIPNLRDIAVDSSIVMLAFINSEAHTVNSTHSNRWVMALARAHKTTTSHQDVVFKSSKFFYPISVFFRSSYIGISDLFLLSNCITLEQPPLPPAIFAESPSRHHNWSILSCHSKPFSSIMLHIQPCKKLTNKDYLF